MPFTNPEVDAVTAAQKIQAAWGNAVASLINELRTAVTALTTLEQARVRQSVAQSLTTSTWTALTFTSEDLDTASGHSTVSNTSRYTVVTGGAFLLSGGCGFSNNVTGVRGVRWAKNGTAINGSESVAAATPAIGNRVAARVIVVSLVASDYVELEAFQSSGAGLNTSAGSTDQPDMTVVRISA
jgi:hypothetical protein